MKCCILRRVLSYNQETKIGKEFFSTVFDLYSIFQKNHEPSSLTKAWRGVPKVYETFY